MNSAELAAAVLPRTRFRYGFAIDEVDALLARCVEGLRAYERGRPSPITPDEIVVAQFRHVRFGEAYDADAVDDLLDRVVVRLREYQPDAAEPLPAPYAPAPEDVDRARRLTLLFKVLTGVAVAVGIVLVVTKLIGGV